MPIAATLPRRTRIVTYATAACFLVLLVCGPLIEASLSERLFSIALVFTSVVLTAFVTRRPAFALALPTVVFGTILLASVIKYHYLATPLLAPDLVYSVNRDLLEIATRYPPILASLIAGDPDSGPADPRLASRPAGAPEPRHGPPALVARAAQQRRRRAVAGVHGRGQVQRLDARRATVDRVQGIAGHRGQPAGVHLGDQPAAHPAVRAGAANALHAA